MEVLLLCSLVLLSTGCRRQLPDDGVRYPVRVVRRSVFGSLYARFGFIDRNGREVIPITFNHIEPFSEGLAYAKRGSQGGYINRHGVFVIPERGWWGKGSFHEGRAPVESPRAYSLPWFIDTTGQMVIEPIYRFVDRFSEGLAAVFVKHPDDTATGPFDYWGYLRSPDQRKLVAALLGGTLAKYLPVRYVSLGAGVLFIVIGAIVVIRTLATPGQ